MAGKDELVKLDEGRLEQYPEWRRRILLKAQGLETTSAVIFHVEGVEDDATIAALEAAHQANHGGAGRWVED